MRVGVLGVGLIGGSIGLAARRRTGARMVGYDPDAGVLSRALDSGAIDELADADGSALAAWNERAREDREKLTKREAFGAGAGLAPGS